MTRPRMVCIAGGSGAGKTTLAEGIAERLGARVSLLHLDDYQKPREEVPRTPAGLFNYDCPEAIDFDRFLRDLGALASGRDVTVVRRKKSQTMSEGVFRGESLIVPARETVVVEGYLALWHPAARASYALSIFLDAPPALRVARRRWAKDPDYVGDVLLPMHDAHIEPTKAFADLVIEVERLSEEQVLDLALAALGE